MMTNTEGYGCNGVTQFASIRYYTISADPLMAPQGEPSSGESIC